MPGELQQVVAKPFPFGYNPSTENFLQRNVQ